MSAGNPNQPGGKNLEEMSVEELLRLGLGDQDAGLEEARQSIVEINPKPLEIAMAYMCKIIGSKALESFLSGFTTVETLRDVMSATVGYLRFVEDFKYDMAKIKELAKYDASVISSLTIEYQKTRVAITPFNWHDNMIAAGPVKLAEDREKSKVYQVGSSLIEVDYINEENAYKSAVEIFKACTVLAKGIQYEVMPYSKDLIRLTMLIAYNCDAKIDADGLHLRFLSKDSLPVGAPPSFSGVMRLGRKIAQSVTEKYPEMKHYYRDDKRQLAVIYANLANLGDKIDFVFGDIKTLTVIQDKLNMKKVILAQPDEVDKILVRCRVDPTYHLKK